MTALHDMPGHLIRRMQQVSNAIFAEECGAFDLTSVQYAALFAVDANDGIDATRLSTMIAVDRSTIGDVLDRLEAKGWITRSAGSSDKRIKRLHLSDEGRALLGKVAPAVERVQNRLLAPVDVTARLPLLEQLRLIADAPIGNSDGSANDGR